MMDKPKLMIGGLPVMRATCAELCDIMVADTALARSGALVLPRFVTSANGSLIVEYHSNRDLRAAVDQADIIDADGMSLVFASKVFTDQPLEQRTATTDFLMDASQLRPGTTSDSFCRGKPGVAARAADNLRHRFPGLRILGVRHGYFSDADIPAICEAVRKSGADVLWVGLGTPLQERFAVRARELLAGVAWIRTCGGLFDHYGGGVSRAPGWMQTLGLEWLYRAAREPLRLGWRYLVTNPRAIYHLVTKTRS
jgi:exopolysaccharide biosynthesis WecB/TagA/CpsF family protein